MVPRMVQLDLSSTIDDTHNALLLTRKDNLDILLAHLLFSSLTLFAILSGSKAGLRIWIAYSQLPPPKSSTPKDGEATVDTNNRIEDDQKNRKRGTRLLILLFCVISAFYFIRFALEQGKHYASMYISGLYFLAIIPSTFGFSFNMFSLMTGLISLVVFRTEIGTFKMQNRSPKMRNLVVLAMLSMAFLAILSPWTIFKWYTYTAFVFQISCSCGTISYNVKRAIIPRFIVTVSALACFAFVIYYVSTTGYDAHMITSLVNDLYYSDTFAVRSYINDWVLPALSNGMSGTLIALALRFDYHIHATSGFGTEKDWIAHVRNLPHETHGGGTVVPLTTPPSFSRTYYLAALTGWSATNASMLALLYTIGMSSRFYMFILYTPSTWFQTLLYAPLSFIGVLTGLCINALLRGELGAVLGYTEIWKMDVIASADNEGAEDQGDYDLEKKVELS